MLGARVCFGGLSSIKMIWWAFKEKRFIFAQLLEVLGRDQLASLLWLVAAHHDRMYSRVWCLPPDWEAKEIKRKELRSHCLLQGHAVNYGTPPGGPFLLQLPLPPNISKWMTWLLPCGLWRTHNIQPKHMAWRKWWKPTFPNVQLVGISIPQTKNIR